MSSSLLLRVWADYVCPWCYVGQAAAQRFSREHGVPLDWQPFLLRPDAPLEGWPLPAYIAERMNRPDNPLTARAEALGLKLVERSWIPNSRRALAANEHVRTFGLEKLDGFHSAVNRRYWTLGEDLSKWETLEGAMQDIGLDASGLRSAVESQNLDARIDESMAAAHALGIQAVPTYVFYRRGAEGTEGDEPVAAIQGAQEYEVFERAARQLGL